MAPTFALPSPEMDRFSSEIRRLAFWTDSISTRCWRAASWLSS